MNQTVNQKQVEIEKSNSFGSAEPKQSETEKRFK